MTRSDRTVTVDPKSCGADAGLAALRRARDVRMVIEECTGMRALRDHDGSRVVG